MDPKVIFCDNHILILDKPAGWLTQPDLEEWGKAYLKKRYDKPGNVFLHTVHRLDKQVSGLVLLARTSKALSRLNEQMRQKKMRKVYRALIEGKPPEKEGTLRHHLRHGSHRAIVSDEGKEAVLHYHVLEEKKDRSLVEVELITGKYHQIRAQFAAIGCPIVGDTKYGSTLSYKNIALNHHLLEFTHPVTKEGICVCSQARI